MEKHKKYCKTTKILMKYKFKITNSKLQNKF